MHLISIAYFQPLVRRARAGGILGPAKQAHGYVTQSRRGVNLRVAVDRWAEQRGNVVITWVHRMGSNRQFGMSGSKMWSFTASSAKPETCPTAPLSKLWASEHPTSANHEVRKKGGKAHGEFRSNRCIGWAAVTLTAHFCGLERLTKAMISAVEPYLVRTCGSLEKFVFPTISWVGVVNTQCEV